MLFQMLMTPHPGPEAILHVLQVALVAGWIGTLLWLLYDFVAGRLRFVAAPVVLWIWLYGIGMLIQQVATLSWGY